MSDDGGLVGQRLGAYRIETMLGEGAMGEVYRGLHETLGRPVAIKTLKPHVAADRSLLERFFAEARAVNIIRHENIVECTDMVQEPGGKAYLVMELLEGSSLGDAIRKAKKMPAARAAGIAAQIADAIAAAHGKGIVHRDLKPENVFLIRRAGSSDYVKVLDFGIARLRPELGGVSATQSGALVGTPAYMSAEQARGEKAGPASDQYALGVIVFHMIAGRLPFTATALPLMLTAHIQDTPPRLDEVEPSCPRALADAVARALEKDPAARFPSLRAFRRAILTAAGLPVGDEPADDAFDATLPPSSAAPDALLATELPAATAPTVAPASPLSGPIGQSSLSGAAGAISAAADAPTRPNRRGILAGAGITVVAVIAILAITLSGVRLLDAAAAAQLAPLDAAPTAATIPVDAGTAPTVRKTRPRTKPAAKPDPVPATTTTTTKPPDPEPEPDRTRDIIR